MYRMLALIWAMGVMLICSHAQAVAHVSENVGSYRSTTVSEGQKSRKAHLTKRRKKSAKSTRHAARAAANRKRTAHSRTRSRMYYASRPRTASRRASRKTRTAERRMTRSRRLTVAGGQAKAKTKTRTAARTRQRATRTVAAGTTLTGLASYYWQPQRVASGGWFNPKAMTAAHKTLPFGTRVRVTNARNGRSVEVTINDRGPYIAGRIIDLSDAAAGAIGMKSAGVVPVKVEVVGR